MQAPMVTVGMPFFNAAEYIEEAIDSVLRQTYSNWELLLAGDGGSDSSECIALRFAAKYPDRIRYLHHEGRTNRGVSATRNLVIRNARGKYIAFLDADDVWAVNKLKSQVAILNAHPEADMVYGLTQYWHSWTGKPEDSKLDFVPDLDVPIDQLFPAPSLLALLYPLGRGTAPSISNVIVRRELAEMIGGFEEQFRGMYEDQAFLVKVYLHGMVFVSGECWDRYRIRSDSCMNAAIRAGEYESVRRLFLDWFRRYLNERGIHDVMILKTVDNTRQSGAIPEVITHYDGWLFRVAGRNQAELVWTANQPELMRIAIGSCESALEYDIQLNLPRLAIRAGKAYRLAFRARADAPRSICCGVAMAHEPWASLGLYRKIDLTTEWRAFEEEFIASEDDGNGRIHFDAGSSDTAVDLSGVTLRSLPGGEAVLPLVMVGEWHDRDDEGAAKASVLPLDGTPPAPGRVDFGSLRRISPLSRNWGYDRGLPIDRYYIENFLHRHSREIRGRVLEIEDNSYTCRFGREKVEKSDVLHVCEGNPHATMVGDLTHAPHLPDAAFDCIILTQTLQLIYDVRSALLTAHRILKPGGVLLATVPGISQTNDREWGGSWYWNFTPLSAERLFQECFRNGEISVETHGNVLSATSFLHGIAAEELSRRELDCLESGYEVTIGIIAKKAGATA